MTSRLWLIDAALFIRAVRTRGQAALAAWIESLPPDAAVTCDLVRAEFLVGVHAPKEAAVREASREFFRRTIRHLRSLPCDRAVMERAGEMSGQARRRGLQATLTDAIVAACAERDGRTVATMDLQDFRELGAAAEDPLATREAAGPRA